MRWGFNPEREAAWEQEKTRLYQEWRERKLQAGMKHLASVLDHSEHMRILDKVQAKYGKRFAEALKERFFKGENNDRA